ncbi:cytochrome P450 [Hypoxylon cercidicola]|nr:cytochrome P450 [Hypoxylon cercidicola]
MLSDEEKELLQRMTYTSAVTRETLPLWLPAGTAWTVRPGGMIKVQTPSEEYNLDGVVVYNCAIMIQRGPDMFVETADDFVPECWMHKAAGQIPTSAWRVFESGPRNCIEQELAALEARIVAALVARHYDFVKVGIGEFSLDHVGKPIIDTKGDCKVVSEMYPVG